MVKDNFLSDCQSFCYMYIDMLHIWISFRRELKTINHLKNKKITAQPPENESMLK